MTKTQSTLEGREGRVPATFPEVLHDQSRYLESMAEASMRKYEEW
jgi:hypothetical protein